MAIRNNCNFIGRLAKKPELKNSASGTAYANGGIAVNNRRKVDGEFVDDTTWVNFVVFGKLAEAMNKYLEKGDLIALSARYTKDSYEDDDGEKQTRHGFIVDSYSKVSSGNASKSIDEEAGVLDEEDDEGTPF